MRIVTFKCPESLAEELDRIALIEGVSKSSIIREALEQYVREFWKGYSVPRIRVRRVVLT